MAARVSTKIVSVQTKTIIKTERSNAQLVMVQDTYTRLGASYEN